MDGFKGVTAKIKRAKKHIADLEKADRALRDADAYGFTTYSELQTRDRVWTAVIREVPSDQFACIVGDTLTNLSAALNYLYFELAGRPQADIYFPLSRTREGFKAAVKGSKKVGVKSKEARRFLAEIEAYPGGNGEALWQLNELVGKEKHRFLTPVIAAYKGMTYDLGPTLLRVAQRNAEPGEAWRLRPGSDTRVTFRPLFYPRYPIEDGTELFRLKADHPDVNMDLQFTFEIAFGKTEVFEGQAILPTLTQLADLVEVTVEPFLSIP